jgi:catalase
VATRPSKPTRANKATSSPPARKAAAGKAATEAAVKKATAKKAPARKATPKKAAPKKAAAVANAEKLRASGVRQASPEDRPVADAVRKGWAQTGEALTTNTGTRVDDTDNSLTAGERGPTLLEDFHLREKITHFDHERIPERVVHARGAGAHGTFVVHDGLEDICRSAFLRTGAETPVFTRFSTVAGSRGSADTVRDVRGFATKFYTEEGNFDLVGNNIPVFFIQDGIKFPDLIHAAKPEPDREIPQAQTAHDTFWDFIGLQPESLHMIMWAMSDRAIPRSYATMEGFGVHTFRLANEAGETVLVKWHWKPVAGVHSLVWEEAQLAAGMDPDFHRRDLYERIAGGNPPQWQLGVQVMPDTPEQTFEGIDLLDATKLVPEELCPVRLVGTMTLDRQPTNFFAEVEQVAFHPGHVVPGIDFVDDPLLHARLFSYIDTQLTRLGGPNFDQIPINRPLAPVNNNQRDGFMQQAVHEGIAPYAINSLDGGCPFAGAEGSYTHQPREVSGPKERQRPRSFDDHTSQAALFLRSLTPPEQEHLANALTFELGKCTNPDVVARVVAHLANIDTQLTGFVAAHLGMEAPEGTPEDEELQSPALSMVPAEPGPVEGRKLALLVDDATPASVVEQWRAAADPLGVAVVVVGPRFGVLAGGVEVDRSLHVTHSIEYDAVVLTAEPDAGMAVLVQEAYRHHKTVGAAAAVGEGLLAGLGIDPESPGVETDPDDLLTALGLHRHWDRPRLGPPGLV